MNIVFFGTPEFGAIVLKKLVESGLKPVLVVTAPDKPAGRKQVLTPPPAKILAEHYAIPVLQYEILANHNAQMAGQITDYNPDLFVVASYGQILPKEILAIPKFNALNVHPSLLPKYRGSSPVQTAILNGEETTGATIMLMDEKMDHGPILAQKRYPVPIANMAYPELHNALAEFGAGLLIETIPQWVAGTIKPIVQDHSKATFTKRLKKEDGRVDWTKPADTIERQVRAFQPWPGTFTTISNQQLTINGAPQKRNILKILKATVLKQNAEEPPGPCGQVVQLADGPARRSPALPAGRFSEGGAVAAQGGKDYLIIEELQLEGGKPMKAKEFVQGHPDFIGSVLG